MSTLDLGPVDRIVAQVLALGEREIPSREIGEMVMQELYKLDKVAYIRFASVYRSFQDASDFRDALKEVENIGAGHAATALSQMTNGSGSPLA